MFNAALQNFEYEGSSDEEGDNQTINSGNAKTQPVKLLTVEEEKDDHSSKSIPLVNKDNEDMGSVIEESIIPEEIASPVSIPRKATKKRKTMNSFNKLGSSIFMKIEKPPATDPEESVEASKPNLKGVEKKSMPNHIGKVLSRKAEDEADMTEDELMEAQIIDCLYKAFTHDTSHHLLFNEDLIKVALDCLE
jgi:hypothetical protein